MMKHSLNPFNRYSMGSIMQNMKRFIIAVLVLLYALPQTSPGQTKINKILDDHYEIIFQDVQQDSIRILQVTDLHLGNDWNKDLAVTKRVRALVKKTQPDLIFITGDLFTGEKDRRSYVFPFAADCFDALGVPWIFVFGNHDPEGNVGREPIRELFSSTDRGIVGFHSAGVGSIKCDFQVDLKLKDAKHPALEIYAFDSGSEPGNKSIKADQVAWYQQKSLASKKNYGQIIPAVAVFHIPLKQYEMLWQDSTLTKTGFWHERVCFEEDDGSVYEAFLKQANVKACICGHDHDDNYWGKYHGGILLIYGHVTGEACYHRHWPPGGKLITLPVEGGELGIKDFVLIIE